MKNNDDFIKFIELKEKYLINPTKAHKEEIEDEIRHLISLGWATPSLKVVYDLQIEKHRTIGLNSMTIDNYDKDKSIKAILKKTYGIEFLPRGIIDYIPAKKLIFNPHKSISFVDDGIDYANLFIPSEFLEFRQKEKRYISFIEWNNYPNIKALFENVFKTIERMNYFVNWLAYGFQTKRKTSISIISKGIQGTGKGVIFEEIIKYAVGERYVTLLDNDALKSKFNGDLENKLFVLANEIKADFREGNTIYERLKTYITDPVIRFEEKNIKARSIPNYFNIWFHSNNDIPLQIQGSDRRYAVFNTKSKKLTEVSKELKFNHISFYIEAVKEERDRFIYDIMSIKYDIQKATTPIDTEEKELIYESSMSKMDVLSDKIKQRDIEYFRDIIEDFYLDSTLHNIKVELQKIGLGSFELMIHELRFQFDGNYIKSNLLKNIYKIFVNENDTDRKIGLQLNRHLGKPLQKKIEDKNFKYRKIDSEKDVKFDSIPMTTIEIYEKNRVSYNHAQKEVMLKKIVEDKTVLVHIKVKYKKELNKIRESGVKNHNFDLSIENI
jgi:hypothetical protein